MVKQIIKKQIEKIEYREKKIFWVLFSVFVFFVASYGMFLNGAIMNAVSKQNMESQMTSLGSNVNALESQYLNIKNGISMNMALSKGFVAVSSDKFASVDSAEKNLSLSINEN
jgi:ABC-type uncharacterized transport system permease subunit